MDGDSLEKFTPFKNPFQHDTYWPYLVFASIVFSVIFSYIIYFDIQDNQRKLNKLANDSQVTFDNTYVIPQDGSHDWNLAAATRANLDWVVPFPAGLFSEAGYYFVQINFGVAPDGVETPSGQNYLTVVLTNEGDTFARTNVDVRGQFSYIGAQSISGIFKVDADDVNTQTFTLSFAGNTDVNLDINYNSSVVKRMS
jgi:hypothetical protein